MSKVQRSQTPGDRTDQPRFIETENRCTPPERDLVAVARARQHKRLKRLWPLLALLGPSTSIVVLVLLLSQGRTPSPTAWVALALVAIVPGISGGLLYGGIRSGAAWARPPLAFGLDNEHARRIRSAIKAGQPVDDADQEIAAELAQRDVNGIRSLRKGLPVFILITVISCLQGDFSGVDLYLISATLLGFAAMPSGVRRARRARRWLDAHGHQASE
jgi:hypothetical protein